MENQDFIKLLEDIKTAGCFYNDADFCRKMGIGTGRLSMYKTGKRGISEHFFHEIREKFPDFFNPKSVSLSDPLDDLIALARFNMERGHDEIDRLIAIMEKREGVAKKEKTA